MLVVDIHLFTMDCNSVMMILPLKNSQNVASLGVKWYFPLIILSFDNCSGVLLSFYHVYAQ